MFLLVVIIIILINVLSVLYRVSFLLLFWLCLQFLEFIQRESASIYPHMCFYASFLSWIIPLGIERKGNGAPWLGFSAREMNKPGVTGALWRRVLSSGLRRTLRHLQQEHAGMFGDCEREVLRKVKNRAKFSVSISGGFIFFKAVLYAPVLIIIFMIMSISSSILFVSMRFEIIVHKYTLSLSPSVSPFHSQTGRPAWELQQRAGRRLARSGRDRSLGEHLVRVSRSLLWGASVLCLFFWFPRSLRGSPGYCVTIDICNQGKIDIGGDAPLIFPSDSRRTRLSGWTSSARPRRASRSAPASSSTPTADSATASKRWTRGHTSGTVSIPLTGRSSISPTPTPSAMLHLLIARSVSTRKLVCRVWWSALKVRFLHFSLLPVLF